jgi:RimJ/RimL family protein N-acetyltransferase
MTSLANLQTVELVTGNLRLRRPLEADAADALLMLQDPAVAQWHPAPAVVDEESAKDWCRGGADWSQGEHATFAIVDETSDRLVGNITLGHIDQLDQRDAAIAYRVAPWARGQGVASSAVDVVTNWAFATLQIERIKLEHSVPNPASCRVAIKCRYEFEGLLRSGFRDESGKRHDAHIHARLASSH